MEGVGQEDREPRLLESQHIDRQKALSEVLDWQAFSDWQSEVWTLLEPCVDASVRSRFLETPPEYVVGDDLSWLEELVVDLGKDRVEIKLYLADCLRKRYESIRAYHGARPTDIQSYYAHGLVPLCTNSARVQLEQIFLTSEFPELDASALTQATKDVGPETREGLVYFEANEKLLIEQCGHYMLYGSEYALAVAAHLPGQRNYRPHLKTIGEPTVFVCDVPLRLIHPNTLEGFAGSAVEHIFSALLEKQYWPSWTRGAGFSIRETLPPCRIAGHYHPDVRRDPFACLE